MPDADAVTKARRFLQGEDLPFAEADALWKQLKGDDDLSLARRIVQRMREKPQHLTDGMPSDTATKNRLHQQQALLTSKDPELPASVRHDEALPLASCPRVAGWSAATLCHGTIFPCGPLLVLVRKLGMSRQCRSQSTDFQQWRADRPWPASHRHGSP
jgi:hypothetical protein